VVVGAAEAIVRHAPSAQLVAPSMVLRIGMLPTSKALASWLARQPNTVLIDPDGDWHDPHGAAEALWIADAAPLCDALAHAVEAEPRSSDPRWLALWQELERRAAVALGSASCEGGWEGAVARAVVEALPSGAQLHVGSSMPIRDLDAFAPVSERRITIHCNRGCNGIDGTVSTALGEALARPEAPTVALIGDLTLLHDLDGLATAAAERARLTVVVVHNDGGGIFRFLPIAAHPTAFERLFVTPQPADIGALATALGIDHRFIDLRVDEPRSIGAALERAMAAEGLSLVEVRVDQETNVARHAQAWARAARALERGERRTL
jgi:2-succinyl-5-enolpyruvyl-6-hydroxy-3-cyclohexene-1-carboxylate synthase